MSASRSLFVDAAGTPSGDREDNVSVVELTDVVDISAEQMQSSGSKASIQELPPTKILPSSSVVSDSESDSSMSSDTEDSSTGALQLFATYNNRKSSNMPRKKSLSPQSLSRGWNVLRKKTNSIIEDVHDMKQQGVFKRRVQSGDRRHRITMQLDGIRQEQLQRLHERAAEKKKSERIISRSLKFYEKIRSIVIHPNRKWKQVWDIAILILVVFSAVHIPLLLAFPDLPDVGVWQVIIDVLFILDFFLCFRTGFVRPDNEIELDQGKIVSHYLKTWFPIDLAACFPLDVFFQEGETDDGSSRQVKALLRLLKLPRLLRLGRLLKFLARFKYAGAMKILKFILLLILVGHWTGCVFFFLLNLENQYGYNTWMETNVGLIVDGEDIRGRYLSMLYTAFLMLIGEGMDMETSLERAYGTVVVLIGTIVTAVIVGNVSFVVSNQNSTQFLYQQKIDMITDEMRALHLPGRSKGFLCCLLHSFACLIFL